MSLDFYEKILKTFSGNTGKGCARIPCALIHVDCCNQQSINSVRVFALKKVKEYTFTQRRKISPVYLKQPRGYIINKLIALR